jgi:hypothetical protein
VPAPSRKVFRWSYVRHVLEEFDVSFEELQLPKINGEELPLTYILRRKVDGVLFVYSGVFGPNERVSREALENICRRLDLKYEEIFGK